MLMYMFTDITAYLKSSARQKVIGGKAYSPIFMKLQYPLIRLGVSQNYAIIFRLSI